MKKLLEIIILATLLSTACAGTKATPDNVAAATPSAVEICRHTLAGRQLVVDAVECYKKHLQHNPALTSELVTAIADGKIDARLHAAAFNALGQTAAPEAASALHRAMVDERQTEMNRARAIIAVQSRDVPESELVDALIKLARNDEQAADSILPATSLLVLAAIANKLDPATGTRVKNDIKNRLATLPAGGGLAAAISAAGNLGDAELLAWYYESSPGLNGPLKERLAAALAQTRSHAAEPVLIALIGDEDNNVRQKAAEALADLFRRGLSTPAKKPLVPTGKTAAAIIARLNSEPAPAVRVQLVEALGAVAAELPVAEQALTDRAAVEKDAQVLQTIGKYVRPGRRR